MRALRSRLGQSMRSAAETHLAILETLESDPEPESLVEARVEGSVAYLSGQVRAHESASDTPDGN